MDLLATRGAAPVAASAVLDVEEGLAAVEAVLRREVASEETLLARMAWDVVSAGGKRLRPRVTLLAYAALANGRASEGWIPDVVEAAAATELIHTATLVHDDIIDQSPLRRGRPTLHLAYGVPHAIVTADFLFARGFGLSSRLPKDIVEFTTEACTRLAEGEVLEQSVLNEDLDLATYYRIIRKKTAEPLRACARGGARIAGASEDVQARFAEYGLELGLAFQIQDDLLDVTGNAAETGKPAGLDAAVGVRTITDLLAGSIADRAREDVVAQARAIAESHVARAKAAIDPVTPPGPARDALMALADGVVRRRS